MASRHRRARVALTVVALAVVGLGVWAWEPLYDWVSIERMLLDEGFFEDGAKYVDDFGVFAGHPARGWTMEDRWTGHYVYLVGFYLETGMKSLEGEGERITVWRIDGAVAFQEGDDGEKRRSPPWLWGVTDETSPTMPAWMKDDAKWQAALAAQE